VFPLVTDNRRKQRRQAFLHAGVDARRVRFDPAAAPPGLRNLLSNAARSPDLASAEALLAEHRSNVSALFSELIGNLEE